MTEASGGDTFTSMKPTARRHRASARRSGGSAVLSHWAVIGVPPCTAFWVWQWKV